MPHFTAPDGWQLHYLEAGSGPLVVVLTANAWMILALPCFTYDPDQPLHLIPQEEKSGNQD